MWAAAAAPGVKGLAGRAEARRVAAARSRRGPGEGGPGAPQSAPGAAAGSLSVASPLLPPHAIVAFVCCRTRATTYSCLQSTREYSMTNPVSSQ